jgi:hypothetical protein
VCVHVCVCVCMCVRMCRTLAVPVPPSSHLARTHTRTPRARTRPDPRAAILVARPAGPPCCRLMLHFLLRLCDSLLAFRRLLTCLCLARARSL